MSTPPNAAQFLAKRGYISSLEQFHWTNLSRDLVDEGLTVIDFIRANDQLKAFTVVYSLSPEYIDKTLLPTFVHGNFHFLCTLYLIWDSNFVPLSSLHILAQIRSLSQLWISAGEQYGWRHNWEIDHKLLLETLSSLICLEDLAFSCDTYTCDVPGSRVERYYMDRILPLNENALDFIDRDEVNTQDPLPIHNDERQDWLVRLAASAWEKRHRMAMESIGSQYADIFPRLRFCYFGQLPMNIMETERGVL